MKRAFTLLEILIATILFALLMASYYTAFIQVIETEQFARESRHFGAIGPAILDLIEDDLVSLYVHPNTNSNWPVSRIVCTAVSTSPNVDIPVERIIGLCFWAT